MYIGESVVEIKTEADSNDITEIQYPHNDKPGTLSSVHLFVLVSRVHCLELALLSSVLVNSVCVCLSIIRKLSKALK